MNTSSLSFRSSLPLYLVVFFLSSALFFSCNEVRKQTAATQPDSSTLGAADTVKVVTNTDSTDDEHAIFYVVIADTGQNYQILDRKMYEISKVMKWPVDTMNRHYDAAKQKIALAENDEDEMYRGEYFPRRSPSASLSLEYFSVYGSPTTESNIALAAGIFEQKASADSMQMLLKAYAGNAFVLKSKIYIGCMH